jgi:adenosylcobinamide-GDP ribazoletransferase
MKYLQLAFSLLTVLPAGETARPEPGDTGRAAFWFPMVGVVIGFFTVVGWGVFKLVVPIIPANILTLILWVVLTGGLHLDGLADCCDGLLSAAAPERRLKIMADPHIGTFGVVGLILALGLKFAALYSLPPLKTFFIIIFAACFSRWLVLIGSKQPLARKDGMAADLAAGLENRSIAAAAIIPAALMLAGGWQAALAAALASLATVGVFAFARNRIGGVTGDVFGLTIEISEIVILLTYAAL